jgi:2-hydroxy-3-oxopropionate reductase
LAVSPQTTPIGFIGLGIMGKAMARNVLKAGFKLTVYNRTQAKAEELAKEGAAVAATPADVARASEIVFTCVSDTPDVEAVLFGAGGVIEGAKPGLVVIDCSTISATATVEFAKRLKAKGVELIDSPVSGGSAGAANGTLSCMIGGDAAAIERCMPAFQAIGTTFVHIGGSGAGQITKSCNQMVICATLLGMSEAVALCKKHGIDAEKMRQALVGGAARSFVMENHCKRLIQEDLEPGFRAVLMLKDMKLASSVGRDSGVFTPTATLATQMLSALCETGRAGKDCAAIGTIFQELSGIK